MAGTSFKRVYSNINVKHDYTNGDLTVITNFSFKPFDVRDYQNEFIGSGRSDSDRLLWLYCTIYNYIPIAIIYNTQPGLYASIESGEWDEVYQGNELWRNSVITVGSNDWEYGSLVNVSPTNLRINNLRELAETYISRNDNWYNTLIGQTFSFTNAINGNIEFSHLNPSSYNGFTNTVTSVLNDPTEFDRYNIWKRHNGGSDICKVTLTTTIRDVQNNENKTFAVVSADPSTGKILTDFIYIKEDSQEPVDMFQYIDGSLTMTGATNEITPTITQVNDKRIKLKITINQAQWKTLTPQIRFKVKHITS